MTAALAPGWYIALYHDVSWEESVFLRHIGGTCPPDVFRDHVQLCEQLGRLVSIQEGMERLKADDIRSPLFSFWFDDGFVGVRRYAAPILAARGITGAASICSRFIARKEMFWRSKLSYLNSIDASRHLRSRLRKCGYTSPQLIRNFTLDRFGSEVLRIIDELYNQTASDAVQDDAFRIFDTPEGILELHDMGWVIANHSAAHYPVGERHVTHLLLDQFGECEQFIRSLIGKDSDYWVLPFSRNIERSAIDSIRNVDAAINAVLVNDRVNLSSNFNSDPRVLYRINATATNRKQLGRALFSAAER